MKALDDLKEMLETEVKKITKKGDITPAELENAYKVVDIIKDIETIKAMSEAEEEGEYSERGYSGARYSRHYPMYPYAMDGSFAYEGGMSGARRRDSMGRFSSRRGGNSNSYRNSYGRYSMDESREVIMDKLEEAMQEAPTERERRAIEQCMDKMSM